MKNGAYHAVARRDERPPPLDAIKSLSRYLIATQRALVQGSKSQKREKEIWTKTKRTTKSKCKRIQEKNT